MVLTQKQMSARSVTHTVFTPLSVAVELDDLSQDWGISRNKLLNLIIAFGLQNKDKLKEALSEGDGLPARAPQAASVPNAYTTTTTPQADSKEIEA